MCLSGFNVKKIINKVSSLDNREDLRREYISDSLVILTSTSRNFDPKSRCFLND